MEILEGRVAVVTGGGNGIGRGLALTLGAEGMTVAVADIQADRARAVAEEIESEGGRALALGVDVTCAESLASAAKEIVGRAGGVNLLCANAGVLARVGSLADHRIEDWEYTFSVNVMGIVKTVSAFLPLLRESAPDAHIVNTASLGGLTGDVNAPIGAYIASKYACVGYSEVLRAELADAGIGVSVLCPGMVASNLMETSAANRPEAFGEQGVPRLAGVGGDENAARQFAQAMSAREAGRLVVRAIRANRLYAVTHPRTKKLVESRFRALLDDFDFAASGTRS